MYYKDLYNAKMFFSVQEWLLYNTYFLTADKSMAQLMWMNLEEIVISLFLIMYSIPDLLYSYRLQWILT